MFIIAEGGVNHNGDLDRAKALIDAAAKAGADAIKFQTFTAETLVTKAAAKASYQSRNLTDDSISQFDMLRALELSHEDHFALKAHAVDRGILFMSTPFDWASAQFLVQELGVDRLKVSSGDLTNAPLLHAMASLEVPLILSSGMATMADIEEALGVLAHGLLGRDDPGKDAFHRAYISAAGQSALQDKISLLHCTSQYPVAPDDINLAAIDTLRRSFGLVVGYSDHSLGTAISVAAAALGAEIIEKHLTVDRTLPGPDHLASLEPAEFEQLVRDVRIVERAQGHGYKLPTEGELAVRAVATKSIVASCAIAVGDTFTADNLSVRRPRVGLEPVEWWRVMGTIATRNYAPDDPISYA